MWLFGLHGANSHIPIIPLIRAYPGSAMLPRCGEGFPGIAACVY
jgi:hypothetical protein